MKTPDARMRLKVATSTSVGAATTSVVLQPEAGVIWEVLWMIGYHDDGAAWMYWLWTDDVVTLSEVSRKQATASYDYLHFGGSAINPASNPMCAPMWVTHTGYPTFQWVATAAAKHGTVKAMVREYLAMDEI